jgi:excisionase family DNA binding protein
MQIKQRSGKFFNDMLTIDEVAGWLRVHPITIRRWEKQNRLKSYRIGPKENIRFMRKDVSNFIAHSNKFRTKSRSPRQDDFRNHYKGGTEE